MSAAWAQAKPDLSGTWNLSGTNPPNYPGSAGWGVPSPTIVVKQGPTEVAIDSAQYGARQMTVVYKLDGSDTIWDAPSVTQSGTTAIVRVADEGALGRQQTDSLHVEHRAEPDEGRSQREQRRVDHRPRNRAAWAVNKRDAHLHEGPLGSRRRRRFNGEMLTLITTHVAHSPVDHPRTRIHTPPHFEQMRAVVTVDGGESGIQT